MADDQIGQDEIEELLRQAQGLVSGTESKPAESAAAKSRPPAVESAALGQDEIEALMSGSAGTTTATQPRDPDGVAQSDVELLLNHAQQAIASLDREAELPEGIAPFAFADLGGSPATTEAATLELVGDVQLDLNIELGRTHMHLEDVLRMKRGSVVPLDKLAGDPVDVYVNGRKIARGEVLVLNDNFCVRVTELVVGDSACA
jgi:flagellar motor switch protein FliN/FliY